MGRTVLVGGALFATQLSEAGVSVVELGDEHVVIPAYRVAEGKFEGLEMDLGVVVPADFPLTPPSGPHVHKLIHVNRGDGVHPDGHIHASSDHSQHFKDGWQYWSRPFPDWTSGSRHAVRYMEYVRALWEDQ